VWQSLNGGSQSLFQATAVGFDGNSKRMVIAAQDTGVTIESARASQAFTTIEGGDGFNAAVNDQTAGNKSAIYDSSQYLGNLTRRVVDAQGNPFGPTPTLPVTLSSDSSYHAGFPAPLSSTRSIPAELRSAPVTYM
jgi:hypothetical protein